MDPALDHQQSPGTVGYVRVLEVDPDLGLGLLDENLRAAGEAAVAPVFDLAPGPWEFFPPPEPGALGALVLSGLVAARVGFEDRAHLDLLSEGEVISLWLVTGGETVVSSSLSAEILTPLRIAYLDRRFALRVARWPEVHAALIRRLVMRARRLSLQSAINAMPRVDDRLEVTLWHMSDRFGRVTPEGVVVTLPLTHLRLAEVIAAQRPSVTTAISRLAADSRVERLGDSSWLLCGDRPRVLAELARQAGLEA